MMVILPYCAKDRATAIKLLEWMAELDGRHTRHEIALLASQPVTQAENNEVIDAARKAFSSVHLVRQTVPYEAGWPDSCNALFEIGCTYAKTVSKPFFWLEPDCTPLRDGWLSELEAEYRACGRPVMGVVYNRPSPHITGCAIYPHNFSTMFPGIANHKGVPWDVQGGTRVMAWAHTTKLIHHMWTDVESGIGPAPTFPNHESLRIINHDAVLFHRCKDGTLIDELRKVKRSAPPATDYEKYYASLHPRQFNESCCIVQLGRIGDILNILPIAKRMRCLNPDLSTPIIVNEAFKRVLDRVNYARPVTYGGNILDLEGASRFASRYGSRVMVAQLFSDKGVEDLWCEYNVQQWMKLQVGNFWGDLPLELNRRDFSAEDALASSHITKGGPTIAYNLEGISSPFPMAGDVERSIRLYFDGANLINLSSITLDTFTDQLGILDAADAIITVDTSTLHLAQASPTPYAALVSDVGPHKNTRVRRTPVYTAPYSKVDIGLMCEELDKAIRGRKPVGRIFHATQRQISNPRSQAANSSWEKLYSTGQLIPAHSWVCGVNAKTTLGDRRDLPFLHDVLEAALKAGADGDDIVMYTNNDIIITPLALRHLRKRMGATDMVVGMRSDVSWYNNEPYALPRDSYSGRDMVAFRASWLRKNFDLVPRFVLGASDWDIVAIAMARNLVGINTTIQNIECNFPECEIPQAGLIHVTHDSEWCKPSNLDRAPSQVYNRTLASAWLKRNTPELRFHWFL